MTRWLLRAFGLLLLVSALALAVGRAPDRTVQSLVANWAQPPSDFVDVRGMVVHLRDEGPRDDPLPIVLLHGTSASLHTWEGWAKQLKSQRRVISFDLPGFGLTGPFTGSYPADDYRGDTYARFVLDLLDTLKLPRVVLGGNSLGGEVAWRVASLAPPRVAALLLVDATGLDFKFDSVPLGFVLASLPGAGHISQWVLPRAAVSASVKSVYGNPQGVSSELVDRYFELTLREGNRRALRLRLQQLQMGEDSQRVDALKLPTLILWGAHDRLVPASVGAEFERRISGSRRVVLAGLGHVPQEEDPVASLLPVKQFLGLR